MDWNEGLELGWGEKWEGDWYWDWERNRSLDNRIGIDLAGITTCMRESHIKERY